MCRAAATSWTKAAHLVDQGRPPRGPRPPTSWTKASRLVDQGRPMVGRAVPQHDQLAIGPFGTEPSKDLDGVPAVGARVGPQPHLAFVVEIQPKERTRADRPGEREATQDRCPRSAQP